MSPIYYNNSNPPNMQGATNSKLHDADGVCTGPTIVQLQPGQSWSGIAADVVQTAGRRATPGQLTVPVLSSPINKTQNQLDTEACIRFAALPCKDGKPSQRWILSPGAKPGDGKATTIKSAVPNNATCMQVNNNGFGNKITVNILENTNGAHGGCASKAAGPDGCKPLPIKPFDPESNGCDYDQAFVFNANGTIALWNTRSIHNGEAVVRLHCCDSCI